MTTAKAGPTDPHVALLASPGMGHFIPLFELANRLVTHHNFHVSFLVITTEASAAQTKLLRSAPENLHVIDLPPTDVSDVITDEMLLLTRICRIVEESLRAGLRPVLTELNRPKALIIDFFCTQAIELGEELEIPVYMFLPPSAATVAFLLYLPALDREVEGEFVDLPEPIQVPGCGPIRGEDLLDQVRDRKNDEYKWLLYHVSRFPKVVGILLNTWEDLEPVHIRAMKENQYYRDIRTPPLYPVGPITRQNGLLTKSQDVILNWLDDQPVDSVLFVALGSGGNLSTHQLTELALGLEQSQQRFILVVRKPHDGATWSAYFNVGEDKDNPMAYLPDGFINRVEGVGLVVPEWAPQFAVLRHASTGGFLSHCGWNSILESISCGVPMIAWPLYAEQRMNAAILASEMGVAMRLNGKEGRGVVGRQEIERAVKVLMEEEEGKELRSRVRKHQESGQKALGSGGSSAQALSRVVDIWKSDY